MFKMTTQIWDGVIGYPVTIREQPSISISEKRNNFIISLALFDLSESVSSNCPPKWTHGQKSRAGVEWGGVSVTPPPQKSKFAQTRKKLKTLY